MAKLNSKLFVLFVKIFFIYIFFEYVLMTILPSSLENLVKFFGDLLLLLFTIFVLLKAKSLVLFKQQKLKLVFLFSIVALVSTMKNNLDFLHFALGLRSLFRYYLLYFLSYYFNITKDDLNDVMNFLIKSFYVEFFIFLIYYFVLDSTFVLNMHYVNQALYLNLIFAILLFKREFNSKMIFLILLLFIQAWLSTSRLAVIGLCLQIFIYIFFISKQKVGYKLLGGVLIIFFIGVFILLLSNFNIQSESLSKFHNLKIEDSQGSNFRLFLLSFFTTYSIENKNYLGDGPNTFGSLYTSQYNPEYYQQYGLYEYGYTMAADSDYTVLLMQFGFIGVFLYYFILFIFYRATSKFYNSFFLTYLSFIVFASFTAPVFSMRISSFSIFVLFAFVHGADINQNTVESVVSGVKNENTVD